VPNSANVPGSGNGGGGFEPPLRKFGKAELNWRPDDSDKDRGSVTVQVAAPLVPGTLESQLMSIAMMTCSPFVTAIGIAIVLPTGGHTVS
jgi:hypothetical protein